MEITFANPAGLWALLGLPVVLAIHFLQRQTRHLPCSTLFLLEKIAPQSLQGRRWEQLRSSVPLWLQLLAVLILAWLLVQPRWLRKESVQRVVIVLDSSLSMSASTERIFEELPKRLRTIAAQAKTTEWVLMESNLQRHSLYSGNDVEAVINALDGWAPTIGTHDFSPAWRISRNLMQNSGSTIFVTDRPIEAPKDVSLFSIAEPFENVGFTGFRTQRDEDGSEAWLALIKNYGKTEQKRQWWIESAGEKSPPQELSLKAGEIKALRGKFSKEALELVLSTDGFALDNRLPAVRPEPKHLEIAIEAGSPHAEFWQKLAASLENVSVQTETPAQAGETLPEGATHPLASADLIFGSYNPLNPGLPSHPGIFFVNEPGAPKKYRKGMIFSENHPLVAELTWQGLLCGQAFSIGLKEGDEVILWQGDFPLIFLRPVISKQSNGNELAGLQLLCNFDLRHSNAEHISALIVLLHRYAESVRAKKIALEARNVDCDQLLRLATDPGQVEPVVLRSQTVYSIPEDYQELFAENASILRAPAVPAFFEVRQASDFLLRGAAQFADSREADFQEAGSINQIGELMNNFIKKNSEEGLLTPLWLLCLLGLLLSNWFFAAKLTG